ncbi:MAG: LodA/GoxA family CTQ-dependent oxidase, partial [Bryobacteraceae bacterium]
MAITELKIHPAIGIVRLGNSPQNFFVGPETADLPSIPAGGYKDAQCRILRQGARFRIFAYHDDGTAPQELTAADADITWRVKLGNKKVAQGGGSAILASQKSCVGPNQRAVFDDGQFTYPSASPVTVPLGEMRTDVDARLVVLGGFGTSAAVTGGSGWYD